MSRSRGRRRCWCSPPTNPKVYFGPIWQGLPQWPYVQQDLLAAQNFTLKDRMPVKRSFSFTGDLKVYETCPRQYQFFREYDFTPSRSAVISSACWSTRPSRRSTASCWTASSRR